MLYSGVFELNESPYFFSRCTKYLNKVDINTSVRLRFNIYSNKTGKLNSSLLFYYL